MYTAGILLFMEEIHSKMPSAYMKTDSMKPHKYYFLLCMHTFDKV
jgi:hypothetical protein